MRVREEWPIVAGSSRYPVAVLGLLGVMCCAFACGSRAGLPVERSLPDAALGGAGGSMDASPGFPDSAAGVPGSGGSGAIGGTGPIVCPSALTLCGDSCVDLQTEEDHCGACGRPCPPDEQCQSGLCSCP